MSNYVCENTSDENCAYDLKEAFEYYSDVDKDKEGYCFVNHMSWPTWH